MSQRNPMNERYTTDKKVGGVSRKSASSAKPKAKVSSGVTTVKKTAKTPTRQERKSKRRQTREQQYADERKYGDPKTKKFKIVRRLWVVFLILSVFCVVMSYVVTQVDVFPEGCSVWFLGGAYVCILVTLYLDLGQIRRMRREHIAQIKQLHTKESRAEQKAQAKLKREQRKQAEEQAKIREVEEPVENNKSLLGKAKGLFFKKDN